MSRYVLVLTMVALLPTGLRATDDLQAQVDALKEALSAVGRQVKLQQLYSEEQIRASGQSGLKLLRSTTSSTQSYYMPTFTGEVSVANMHNHANNERTIGLGELSVVLNGVHFRTRHNDYRLYMPSTTSSEYGAYDHINLPDVPPAVLQKATVEEQITELREWFKAFADQDHSVRDYRPHFPAVLCYLEGTWTDSDPNTIEDSFESDRHFLDATSWLDMQEKVQFCSLTGHKDNLENFAYLPTALTDVDSEGQPTFAQWNYRIMCHKLSNDLPTNRLHQVDDLSARMKSNPGKVVSMDNFKPKRSARFRLNKFNQNVLKDLPDSSITFLDELMYEIPGMDNYPADLIDDAFGNTALHMDPDEGVLRAGYYHRLYRIGEAGADGKDVLARGWSDPTLYMAMNSQPHVIPQNLTRCNNRRTICNTYSQRWSYAIPLEIIYMTPLTKWNPLGLEYKGDADSELGQTVFEGPDFTRKGYNDPDKAYNGTNSKTFYWVPTAFFESEGHTEPADTTRDTVYVLDRQGNIQGVRASGHRITMPSGSGLGEIRQRYPIMPAHAEGSITWKELDALKDVVMEPNRFYGIHREFFEATTTQGTTTVMITQEDLINEIEIKVAGGVYPDVRMRTTTSNEAYGSHMHYFTMTPEDMQEIFNDSWGEATTTFAEGHFHEIKVKRVIDDMPDGTTRIRYAIARLDGSSQTGQHGRNLIIDSVF